MKTTSEITSEALAAQLKPLVVCPHDPMTRAHLNNIHCTQWWYNETMIHEESPGCCKLSLVGWGGYLLGYTHLLGGASPQLGIACSVAMLPWKCIFSLDPDALFRPGLSCKKQVYLPIRLYVFTSIRTTVEYIWLQALCGWWWPWQNK